MARLSEHVRRTEDAVQQGWQEIQVEFKDLTAKATELFNQGKLRRIVVKRNGEVVAQFPLRLIDTSQLPKCSDQKVSITP